MIVWFSWFLADSESNMTYVSYDGDHSSSGAGNVGSGGGCPSAMFFLFFFIFLLMSDFSWVV